MDKVYALVDVSRGGVVGVYKTMDAVVKKIYALQAKYGFKKIIMEQMNSGCWFIQYYITRDSDKTFCYRVTYEEVEE